MVAAVCKCVWFVLRSWLGNVWDGRSLSLRGRSWARCASEGPALSVLKRLWIVNVVSVHFLSKNERKVKVVGVKCWHVLKLAVDACIANVSGLFCEAVCVI